MSNISKELTEFKQYIKGLFPDTYRYLFLSTLKIYTWNHTQTWVHMFNYFIDSQYIAYI